MKQKILTLLLSAAVLAFAGCGDVGVISGPDGSTTVVAGDVELTCGGGDSDQDILPEEDVQASLPEEDGQDAGGASDSDRLEESGSEDQTSSSSGDDSLYQDAAPELAEDGTYNSAEDVSLYLHLYDHLPDNYITKSEARDLGWTGGSVERYAPGCAIGGDRFGNREGLLPSENGRTYYECDIDTIGESSRGAKRIIFSNDGLIYYTEDHYESFTLLYGEE